MDCRDVESQLAILSAEDLSESAAATLREHLMRCTECEKEWQMFQATMLMLSTTSQPIVTAEVSEKLWQCCSDKLHERIEQQRLAAQRPAWWNWARTQPRWGWAALGGAVAVFGGVWLYGPQESQPSQDVAVAQLPAGDQATPGTLVNFQTPPDTASTMVNNHTAMTFDPFIDHVASNLVSYSATAPSADTPRAQR